MDKVEFFDRAGAWLKGVGVHATVRKTAARRFTASGTATSPRLLLTLGDLRVATSVRGIRPVRQDVIERQKATL